MIKAFHLNWTIPSFQGSYDKHYYMEDFEILTTILSALKWRENNGGIKMVTDERGAEHYKTLGIESIWNLGVDVSLDNCIHKDIDPKMFWAAGKIYSLKKQQTPCAMIDTDFIVWKPIEEIIVDSKVCIIHKETISEKVYPRKKYFNMKNNYKFDEDWDWTENPCNTAFTYIADEELKNYYVDSAIDFMKNAISSDDRLTNMVFAEQRLISMCAKKMGIPVDELTNLDSLFKNEQTNFTHIWGFKSEMKKNFAQRSEFCIRCIKRIIEDFPEYEEVIANMKQLAYFYKQYK
ncbi:DUF6734 family protein [Clostridium vincentii]|uniref:DUF6734 domain-containing protein n=1 Tax=Clostridium vincentii TaxID=52704 RepID=A0A2T0BFN4_9CLOT|nr:DUF6734 family protein [Clostridium vincentii]PRR82637.1 hypothetical protein CLVI_16040 [Clostridium vincentii]